MKDVKLSLIESSTHRHQCHCCGEQADRQCIRAVVRDGPYRGFNVCERCIEARGFDEKLEAYARRLEEQASTVRELKGRLDVPTIDEYRAAEAKTEAAFDALVDSI